MKKAAFLLTILIMLSFTAMSQDNSKMTINDFIRKYAPADSALKLVNNLAVKHYLEGNSVLSRLVYQIYSPLFPDKKEYFARQIFAYENMMLTQYPTTANSQFYDAFINEEAPKEKAFVALQRLVSPYIISASWDSAANIYRSYKPLFPEYERRIDQIIDIILSPEEGLEVKNLGTPINSRYNEWDPTPTPDGKYLFFSSSNRSGGKGGDDVWYSEFNDSVWSKPLNLGSKVNGKNDETVDNVTSDGTGLLLSGTFTGTFGRFDIYYAEKTADGWGGLQHFPMPVNSRFTDEAANFAGDGKTLLFSSDRPGGEGQYHPFGDGFHGDINGNMDIWITVNSDTGWTEPINLGNTINTPYAERSPYLHPDGRTLYFSSDGHAGLGKLDVFVSRRLNDSSWIEWSEPQNLGKEINTPENDLGYVVDLKGERAYFASNNRPEGLGGWDIYTISLPQSAKPDQVVLASGRILGPDGKPIESNVIWEDLSTGKIVGRLKSDPSDGSYKIALPVGKIYGYYAEKDGHYSESRNIDLRQIKSEPELRNGIKLIPFSNISTIGTEADINNVFFDFDKYHLKSESFPELNRLAAFMKQYPDLKILIEGHTDIIGNEEYNLKLSEKRAESLKEYLVSKGIPQKRIETKGFGSAAPIGPNNTEEGRQKNRRVVARFFKK